jgi:hypothetical protein
MGWKEFLGFPEVPPGSYRIEESKLFAANARIGWTIAACGILGVPVIAIWAGGVACRVGSAGSFWVYFGGDLLVAVAAAAAGALAGFIFGLPRTLDPARREDVVQAVQAGDPVAVSHAAMAANTNLERISDWLTTLLIGATLVQIKSIIEWVGELGQKLVTGSVPNNEAVVPIIVIYYFALGFLGVYLVTRLYVTFALGLTLSLLTGIRPGVTDGHPPVGSPPDDGA